MSDSPVTLDFLAAQMRRLQADVRLLRDDMDVVAAMVRRLDHSIARLETNQALVLDELRAMHGQQQRTAARVRALEEQEGR
jgi:prefoldin subunit 5